MAETTVYNESNLESADLHIMLKGLKLGPNEINVMSEEYEDWHNLIEDDTNTQHASIRRLTHYRHAQKVKFLRYKVVFKDVSMCDVANNKLDMSHYGKCIDQANKDIRSGAKKLPVCPHFWRTSPDHKLPIISFPALHHDNHNFNLPISPPFEPTSFADADWAANTRTRRSVSGSAAFLAGAPIVCECKLQHIVALSSTESELHAACEVAKNAKYARSVMKHLGLTISSPTSTYEDNAGTIAASNNQRATKRLRHVDLRHFALLEGLKMEMQF